MKIPTIVKRQQFKDNRIDDTKSKELNYQHLDKHNKKEKNSLNKDKHKIKDAKYVFPSFIPLFLF